MKKQTATVIGRHSTRDIEDEFYITQQINVQFSANSTDAHVQLHTIAYDNPTEVILLQSMPPSLAAGLIIGRISLRQRLGVIIPQPGERPAARTTEYTAEPRCAAQIAAAAADANPNAHVETDRNTDGSYTVYVTVDTPMKFKFSHIEWLN